MTKFAKNDMLMVIIVIAFKLKLVFADFDIILNIGTVLSLIKHISISEITSEFKLIDDFEFINVIRMDVS